VSTKDVCSQGDLSIADKRREGFILTFCRKKLIFFENYDMSTRIWGEELRQCRHFTDKGGVEEDQFIAIL